MPAASEGETSWTPKGARSIHEDMNMDWTMHSPTVA